MHSLYQFAAEKLRALEAKHLRRRLWEDRRLEGAIVERAGRRLISFACNDYLGLSTAARLIVQQMRGRGLTSAAAGRN